MRKKVITAVLIIWIVGMIAFFLIPNSVLEEATTVATTIAETIAEITTTETTTESTTAETTKAETTTTELDTTKAQVNVRRKAVVTRNTDETTTKKVVPTTKKVVETTTKKPVQPTTKKVESTTKKSVETTTKKVEATSRKNTYTSADTYLLAQIIQAEASICSRDEMAKVGKVVLNRVETNYPDFKNCNTIREVLNQPGQYASQTLREIEKGIKPSKNAMEVAEGLVNGTIDSGFDKNVLWQVGLDMEVTWDATVVKTTEWHKYAIPN